MELNAKIKDAADCPRRRRLLGNLLNLFWILVLILSLARFFWVPTLSTRLVDFPVYFEAGNKAWAGHTVYDVIGHFQYKYSPAIAWIMGAVFHRLTYENAAILSSWICRILWLGTAAYWIQSATKTEISFPRLRLAALLFIFLGGALELEIQLGQINAWVFALVTFYWAKTTQPSEKKSLAKSPDFVSNLTASAAMAFAIQLKLYAAIFLLGACKERRFALVTSVALLTVVLSIGIPSFHHGLGFSIDENFRWLSSLTQSSQSLIYNRFNTSLLGVIGKFFNLFFENGNPAIPIWMLAGLAFVGLYLKTQFTAPESFAVLAIGLVLLTPLVWSYWILWLIPALALLFARPFRGPSEFWIWLLPFCAFRFQHAHLMWNGPVFFCTLGVGYLIYSRRQFANPLKS